MRVIHIAYKSCIHQMQLFFFLFLKKHNSNASGREGQKGQATATAEKQTRTTTVWRDEKQHLSLFTNSKNGKA